MEIEFENKAEFDLAMNLLETADKNVYGGALQFPSGIIPYDLKQIITKLERSGNIENVFGLYLITAQGHHNLEHNIFLESFKRQERARRKEKIEFSNMRLWKFSSIAAIVISLAALAVSILK